jgi:hypothetical protein
MAYGIIEYNDDGEPKCEICGKFFKRVLAHVRQKHLVAEKEYKTTFGFDLYKGICSKDSSEKSREAVYRNYDKCVEKNLLFKGEKTRFVKGSDGRTKDKVSEQTKLMLKKRLKDPVMVEKMKESGKTVGKSGLGNKKRWGK